MTFKIKVSFKSALSAMVVGALTTLAAPAMAQNYPNAPITLVVGSGPGSAPDTISRIVGDKMGEILGQPVVVDNRPGAAGGIGASFVARAKPDGYTLMMMTAVHSLAPSLGSESDYSFVNDFEAVGMVASVPLLFVVNNELGTKDMDAFIAKAKTDKLFYSTPGVGTLQHLATEDFSKKVGIKMEMIPYKGGGPATQAVITNEVQLFYAGIPPALPHVKSGALTALGISTPERSAAAPDVPTFRELGFDGYNVDNWHAIYVPKETSPEVIEKLSAALNQALALPAVAEQLLNVGGSPSASSPAAQEEFGLSEVARWATVIKDNNISIK